MEKWPILNQNHGLTLCKNHIFSTFWTCCFYTLERRFFVLEYRKTHFPSLYCLKTKHGKMANFGPKPWVNPFEKITFFPLFELAVFIAQKRVLSFRNIVKHIFLAYIASQQKMKKWPILNQYHGLTPLQKSHFFHFLNLLFL